MKSIKQYTIQKYSNHGYIEKQDFLAVEEPLEISLIYWQDLIKTFKKISITMRTPGHDRELALGFLFTENIIQSYSQINHVNELENRIEIELNKTEEIEIGKLERNFYTTSSCGVCGKSSIDAIRVVTQSDINKKNSIEIEENVILSLKDKINEYQSDFEKTGGIHASALFDMKGNLISIFEDVGRHNALDKLIGDRLINGNADLNESILLLSGRASFELIQKAIRANIGIVCAIGAPSSLAIELAKEFHVKLIGFLKENSFNLYS